MTRPYLSIVLPCLNEEKTLKICIEKCFRVFSGLNISGEIIISDNGSTDNSVKIAQDMGVNVVHCSQKGYGNALLAGLKSANGVYLAMCDADNTYDILELKNYVRALTNDTDMVIGTRLKGFIEQGAMPALHRYFGTPFLTIITNILYGTKITDINCGMRLFKKEAFDAINFKSGGMEFATDLIIEFKLHKFNIKEIPISLYKDVKGRKPHLRPFRDGFRHLFLILRKRMRLI